MEHLEFRIEVLKAYTDDQWQALLDLSTRSAHPGRFVVVYSRDLEIRLMLEAGMTQSAIAKRLGVSASLITRILKGERRG